LHVLVPQEVARFFGVVAVHRRPVSQRVEGRQVELASLDAACHEAAAIVEDQLAVAVPHEQLAGVGPFRLRASVGTGEPEHRE
jgi:hypothetical protein